MQKSSALRRRTAGARLPERRFRFPRPPHHKIRQSRLLTAPSRHIPAHRMQGTTVAVGSALPRLPSSPKKRFGSSGYDTDGKRTQSCYSTTMNTGITTGIASQSSHRAQPAIPKLQVIRRRNEHRGSMGGRSSTTRGQCGMTRTRRYAQVVSGTPFVLGQRLRCVRPHPPANLRFGQHNRRLGSQPRAVVSEWAEPASRDEV